MPDTQVLQFWYGVGKPVIQNQSKLSQSMVAVGEAEKVQHVHGLYQLEQLVPDFRYGEQAWDLIQVVAVEVPMEVLMEHMQK